jgi:hypothetical protein
MRVRRGDGDGRDRLASSAGYTQVSNTFGAESRPSPRACRSAVSFGRAASGILVWRKPDRRSLLAIHPSHLQSKSVRTRGVVVAAGAANIASTGWTRRSQGGCELPHATSQLAWGARRWINRSKPSGSQPGLPSGSAAPSIRLYRPANCGPRRRFKVSRTTGVTPRYSTRSLPER